MQWKDFKFKQPEWSNWKGKLCEELALDYVREVLVPELKAREKWQYVFVMKPPIFMKIRNVLRIDREAEEKGFYFFGVCPRDRLLGKYIDIGRMMTYQSCLSDGLLLKLNDTGKRKSLDSSVTRLELPPELRDKKSVELPIVDGEIEILEVKSGKSPVRAKQKVDYNSFIMAGFPLRLARVEMISFDKNNFRISDERITEPFAT